MFHILQDWFDIPDDDVFREVLNRDAQISYNNWKSDLSEYFKNNGGMQSAKPQNITTEEQWRKCCERFNSAKFQVYYYSTTIFLNNALSILLHINLICE